jgi:Carboxypeptidase regulatory-like domain
MPENNHVRATAIAVLMVLSSFSTQAQQQAAAVAKPDEPSTGTISGRVVNENGQPLTGATVFARAVGTAMQGRTITDSEGNFQVSALDQAAYSVSAMLPAYATAPRDSDTPTYYRVGDSVRLELVKGGVITGTVTTATGEPVVAINVRAYRIRDAKGQPPKTPLTSFGERSTDDRGIYRIYGLAPGTYLVAAGGSGYSYGFWMNGYDSDSPTYAPASTRDNAAEITVRIGEESSVDIRYRGEPGHTVSGTTKTQGPNGTNITLMPVGSDFMPVASNYQPRGTRGFAISGVGDGDYELVAQEVVSAEGAASMEMALSEPRRITVKGADVTGIELTTKPLGSIGGRIALEPSKIPECQGKRRPLFGETLVSLLPNDKTLAKGPSEIVRMVVDPTSPDKEGAFTIRNVLAGQYSFNPRFFARYWYLQSMSLATGSAVETTKPSQTKQRIDAARNWIIVKSGDRTTGLTITLAEGAASLRGKVTVSEGSTLPTNLYAYLVPAEREKADDVLRFFATEVAGDGTFAINAIPPGRYWSIAQVVVDKEAPSMTKLRLPDAAETRQRISREAAILKLETEFKPCQNVTDYKLPLKTN